MLNKKSLMIAVCLAALPWISSPGAAAPGPQGQPGQPQDKTATNPQPGQQMGQSAADPAQHQQAMAQMRVWVLASALGVQSADQAAAAMYQIANAGQFSGADLQSVVDFADKAISTARTSAKQLSTNKQLSAQEKTDARNLVDNLDEAQKTLATIKRRPGVGKGKYDQQGARDFGQDAVQLHSRLDQAGQLLDNIARGHQFSTNLNFPAQPVARQP